MISEYEPIEAFALLADDDLDLALTYDYNLAPASISPVLETMPLWSVAWGLGVPSDAPDSPANIADYADRTWIVKFPNSSTDSGRQNVTTWTGQLVGRRPGERSR